MIRGTTPTHIFTIPVDHMLVEKVRVVYKHRDDITLEKEAAGADLVDGKLKIRLTQEETMSFPDDSRVEIQVRVLTTGGDAMASGIIPLQVCRLLDDEVLA